MAVCAVDGIYIRRRVDMTKMCTGWILARAIPIRPVGMGVAYLHVSYVCHTYAETSLNGRSTGDANR